MTQMMMMDILRYKRRQDFSNLLQGYRRLEKVRRLDIVREGKGVEYTASKLCENKTRA